MKRFIYLFIIFLFLLVCPYSYGQIGGGMIGGGGGSVDLSEPGEIGATTPDTATFTDEYLYGADVTHGMTSIAPTADYMAAFQIGASGGFDLYGMTEANQSGALRLTGIIGATDPTDSYPAVVIRGGKKNGTGWQALGAAETPVMFYNYTTAIGTVYGNGEWILPSLQSTPIGSTIASTGAFTSVTASTTVAATGNVSGASLSTTRTDNPQAHQFYEAMTTDGDSSLTFSAPPLGTGFKENGTMYQPDVGANNGAIPLVISQGFTATTETDAGTEDVTGSSITLSDDTFCAGKTLKWTLSGNVAGGAGVTSIYLYVDNADIVTLATADTVQGDFKVEFTVSEYTDYAHQFCTGTLLVNGQHVIYDQAVDTTDFAGGAKTIKCRIGSDDATDTVTLVM
jgi:hypothetical protein